VVGINWRYEMRDEILSIVYGILQIELKDRELLETSGKPKTKNIDLHTADVLNVYKWLSGEIKDVYEKKLNEYADRFNVLARKLQDDYLLNMTLMGLWILYLYVEEYGTKSQKILLQSKIDRAAKHFSENMSKDTFKDSLVAGDNLFRLYTGKPELTKEIREARVNAWRRKASNSKA
jgi:hypothetical protein